MKYIRFFLLKTFVLLILFSGCKKENNFEEKVAWQEKSLIEVGIDSSKLSFMKQKIVSSMPYVDAFLIVKNGFLVYEEYFNGYSRNQKHLICSDTKSITNILNGILLKKHFINNLDQKILDFFPEYKDINPDPRIKQLTIRNMMSFTSGLSHDEWNTVWETSDMIKTYLARDFVADPGMRFNYETPASQILSSLVNKTTGMNASKFAQKELFSKLGILDFDWPADANNFNYGGYKSYFRPYDMLKFGYLYLKRGVWQNDTIVNPSFVDSCTIAHSAGGKPHFEKYGYNWWVTTNNGFNAFFAGGFGGQYIYVVPELNLVVVITCNTDEHRENARFLINDFVVPAIKDK